MAHDIVATACDMLRDGSVAAIGLDIPMSNEKNRMNTSLNCSSAQASGSFELSTSSNRIMRISLESSWTSYSLQICAASATRGFGGLSALVWLPGPLSDALEGVESKPKRFLDVRKLQASSLWNRRRLGMAVRTRLTTCVSPSSFGACTCAQRL